MRIYGSIQTKFWSHIDIYHTSDQAKLLATYLLSSPHTSMLGCFRIPIGYVAQDLNWANDKVERAFDELSQVNFLVYDKVSTWVIINNFLKYHPIENPNQGKSIAKLFEEIPKNSLFIAQVADKLLRQNKHLSEAFVTFLQTLTKPFGNQEQNKEQEQKQELITSDKSDIHAIFNNKKMPKKDAQSKHIAEAIEVLKFLNTKTGRAYRPVDINLKLIIARLKSGATVLDCRQVIAKKTREWKGDPKMAEYLRPATLFNAVKFEQYMGELVMPTEEIESGFIR